MKATGAKTPGSHKWKTLWRSDRWLQIRLWRRRWQRLLSWLRLLDLQTYIGLGLLALFGLSVLIQGVHALRPSLEGLGVVDLGKAASSVDGLHGIFAGPGPGWMGSLLLLAALLALRAEPFRPPLQIDDFTLWRASQAEAAAKGYLLRQTVWTQLIWSGVGLLLGGIAIFVANFFGVGLPFRPAPGLVVAFLLVASVPGWSAALYSAGPTATWWMRRLRFPIVAIIGLLMNWLGRDPGPFGWETEAVLVVAAVALAGVPLLLISRRHRLEWERLISDARRVRKAASIANPEERRLYTNPLFRNVVARSLSRMLYVRGRWGLTVKNTLAWMNESPFQAVAVVLAAVMLPLVAPSVLQIPAVGRVVQPFVLRLAAGEQGLWLYVAALFGAAGTFVTRLPRAGWRQEMREPERRRWPGSAADYAIGSGIVSAVLALSAVTVATVVVGQGGGGPAFAVSLFLWALTLVPLWVIFAIHESWLDTLPAPPGMGLSPLQSGGNAGMGLPAAIAFNLLPGFVLMFGLAATKSVYVALLLSALAALRLAFALWRWVQGAWP